MSKVSSRIVGASGEHYVVHQLLRRGYLAALAPDGAPNLDIIVTDIDSKKLCSIQVKTRRDIGEKGWHMNSKHERMRSENLFYCFVDMGKTPSDLVKTFIVPSKVVAKVVQLSHEYWLNTPGAKGQQRNDNSMRRLLYDYTRIFKDTDYQEKYQEGWLDYYLENWELITGDHP